jgi:hypothetical protein
MAAALEASREPTAVMAALVVAAVLMAVFCGRAGPEAKEIMAVTTTRFLNFLAAAVVARAQPVSLPQLAQAAQAFQIRYQDQPWPTAAAVAAAYMARPVLAVQADAQARAMAVSVEAERPLRPIAAAAAVAAATLAHPKTAAPASWLSPARRGNADDQVGLHSRLAARQAPANRKRARRRSLKDRLSF